MPRVPRLPGERVEPTGVPSTGLSPLESPRLNVQVDPQSLGSSIGGGLVNLGTTGLEIARREKIRQDEARVRSAQRLLQEWELETLWTGENAAMRRQGIDTAAMPGEVEESFRQTSSQIREGLANDEQKIRFDDLSELHRLRVNEQTARHQIREMDAFKLAELKAVLANSVNLAVENAPGLASSDATERLSATERIAEEIDSQVENIVLLADEQGWGPQQITQLVESTRSDTHVGIVKRLLAEGQDVEAKEYYDALQGEILPGRIKDDLITDLNEGAFSGEVFREVDRILQTTRSRAEAREAAENISDGPLRKEVARELDSWWVKTQQMEDRLRDEQYIEASNIIADGGSYLTIPPAIRSKLTQERKNSLRRAEKELREKGKIETKIGRWYELINMAGTDPDSFEQLFLPEEVANLSEADIKFFGKLQLDMREKKREARTKINSIRSTKQIIEKALRDADIDPEADDVQEAIGALWYAVDIEQQDLQENNVTVDDKVIQGIVDRQVDLQNVEVEGSWWGLLPFSGLLSTSLPFTTTKPRFRVTPEEINRNQEVSLIPLSVRREIERELIENDTPPTGDNIMEYWNKMQEVLEARQKRRSKGTGGTF